MNLPPSPSSMRTIAGTCRGLAAAAAGVGAALAVAAGTTSAAQALAPAAMAAAHASQATRAAAQVRPERRTLARMMTRLTATFDQTPLRDVMAYIRQQTQADMEIFWEDDRSAAGLDPEQPITLTVKDLPALTVLERVLDKATNEFSARNNNWQMTEWGEIQAGPSERLNRFNRTEIYDINDLLLVLPEYDNVPEIDLDQALQSGGGGGGGGGGGQSPFEDTDEDDEEEVPLEERADEIIELIEQFVEPEHWIENPRASIAFFRGNIIVRAPDYVHRGIDGYPYWPSRRTVTVSEGRRYVSMSMDTGIATVDGFAQQPISAVVGGRIIQSDQPPGGGG